MGAFDPADVPELPAVVRQYAAARRRWLVVAYDEDQAGHPAHAEFASATRALGRALAEQGGSWEVDGLIYKREGHHGISIEQTAARVQPGASGQVLPAGEQRSEPDLAEHVGGSVPGSGQPSLSPAIGTVPAHPAHAGGADPGDLGRARGRRRARVVRTVDG